MNTSTWVVYDSNEPIAYFSTETKAKEFAGDYFTVKLRP